MKTLLVITVVLFLFIFGTLLATVYIKWEVWKSWVILPLAYMAIVFALATPMVACFGIPQLVPFVAVLDVLILIVPYILFKNIPRRIIFFKSGMASIGLSSICLGLSIIAS